jgi:hypothetical protein
MLGQIKTKRLFGNTVNHMVGCISIHDLNKYDSKSKWLTLIQRKIEVTN